MLSIFSEEWSQEVEITEWTMDGSERNWEYVKHTTMLIKSEKKPATLTQLIFSK